MFLLLLFVLIVTLLLIFIRKRKKQTFLYWKQKGVPHEEPWMVFGNLSSVIFRKKAFVEYLQDAYQKYSNDRYFGYYKFLMPTLVIRDIELIKQICIREFDKFSDHVDFLPKETDPVWNNGLFALQGSDWHDMRTILSPAFTGTKMRAMFRLMTECAQEFVNHFQNQKSEIITVDMHDALTRYTNDVAASCTFGVKCNSFEQRDNEFYVMGKKAFNVTGFNGFKFFGCAISPTLMKLLKVTMFGETATNFFRRIVKETIQYREKTGLLRPDMIHLLMQAQKGRLHNDLEATDSDISNAYIVNNEKNVKKIITDEDIMCQAAIFLFGGYDTVGYLLCNVAYELAANPDIQEKLISEIDRTLAACNENLTYDALVKMKYLDMVVSETLRLWTPATFLERKCVKAFTIEPVLDGERPLHLDSGTECVVPVCAIHRDPEYFPNPNKFDPERFNDDNKRNIKPFTYMPFGVGPRICIGNRFALLEAKAGLFFLLTCFKIVPVEKTSIPYVLDKGSIMPQHKYGYWLGLKRRFKPV